MSGLVYFTTQIWTQYGILGVSKGKPVKLALSEPQRETAWGVVAWEKFAGVEKNDWILPQIRVFCQLLRIRTLRINNLEKLLVLNVLFALFFVGPMTTVAFQPNNNLLCATWKVMLICLHAFFLLHSLGWWVIRVTSDSFTFSFLKL